MYFPVQYLLGQFYSDEVYREHTDWERKTKLGHGAQASCFSVSDNRTKCILVLKEVRETVLTHTRMCMCTYTQSIVLFKTCVLIFTY